MRRLLGAALILAAHPVAAPLPLAIVQLKFHEYEGGPPVRSGFSPSTGDTVFLSFQVQGFQVSPEQKIDVRCRMTPPSLRKISSSVCVSTADSASSRIRILGLRISARAIAVLCF